MLPPPNPFAESAEHAQVHTLDKLGLTPENAPSVKPYTVLRCALEEASATGTKLTAEDLFTLLEQRFPWLSDEEHETYRVGVRSPSLQVYSN